MVVVHRRERDSDTARTRCQGRRLLVVADEAAASAQLVTAVRTTLADEATARVLLVAPAPSTRLRHSCPDSEAGRTAAVRRLQACIGALTDAGIDAEGMLGAADPVEAVADALRIFPADLVIVATVVAGRTTRPARDAARRVREQFALPARQLVVRPPAAPATG